LLAPVAKFLFRRNVVELGGAGGILYGAGCYITSKIGIDRLLKWTGITLGSLGILAIGLGKFVFGIKLTAEAEPKQKEEASREDSDSMQLDDD